MLSTKDSIPTSSPSKGYELLPPPIWTWFRIKKGSTPYNDQILKRIKLKYGTCRSCISQSNRYIEDHTTLCHFLASIHLMKVKLDVCLQSSFFIHWIAFTWTIGYRWLVFFLRHSIQRIHNENISIYQRSERLRIVKSVRTMFKIYQVLKTYKELDIHRER